MQMFSEDPIKEKETIRRKNMFMNLEGMHYQEDHFLQGTKILFMVIVSLATIIGIRVLIGELMQEIIKLEIEMVKRIPIISNVTSVITMVT